MIKNRQWINNIESLDENNPGITEKTLAIHLQHSYLYYENLMTSVVFPTKTGELKSGGKYIT